MTASLVRSYKYSSEEVDRAFLVIAMNGGSAARAAKQLKANGLSIPARTLRTWRQNHPDHYESICTRHRQDIQDRVRNGALATAVRSSEGMSLGVDKAVEKLQANDYKDPSAVAKNLAVVFGINTEKALLLSGQPTQRIEHRDAAEILRAIRARVTVLEKEKGHVDGEVVEESQDTLPASVPQA